MDVRVGLWRRLSAIELTLLNCGVGEDSWESLGLQGDPTVHSEGDQSWVFIGRTETELQYFGHLIWRVYSLEKSLMLGGIGSRRRRGRERMRRLDGITDSMDTFEQTPEDSEGQGSLEYCSPWGHKESDTTERINWTDIYIYIYPLFYSFFPT